MTLRDWTRQLEQNPTDWDLYGPFSDWLEERCRTQQAYAIRWMAKHRKTPERHGRWWTWGLPGYAEPCHAIPEEMINSSAYFSKGTFWQQVEALGRGWPN